MLPIIAVFHEGCVLMLPRPCRERTGAWERERGGSHEGGRGPDTNEKRAHRAPSSHLSAIMPLSVRPISHASQTDRIRSIFCLIRREALEFELVDEASSRER